MSAGSRGALTVLLHGDPAAPQQARLGAALAARGHRVVVCDAPKVAAQIRDEHRLRCDELLLGSFAPAALFRAWSSLRVHLRGVDVVHLNYLRPFHKLWASMPAPIPYVATAWGSDLNEEVFHRSEAHRRDVDLVLSRAAALTADSAPLLERARARAKSDAPAELVYWGVDLAQFDRARASARAEAFRRELAIEPGARVLLSPRQPRPIYHVDRILRAFAASRAFAGGILVIKLHGRAGEEPERDALASLARDLGVASRVRFAPPSAYADLPGLYALADAAVSVPEADGWPSTFCELMALGVPIVATDLPAYEGALVDGESALLVPPGDHGALVAALDRIASSEDLRARCAGAGLAWARAHADWSRGVDRFEALYRGAVARSARRPRGTEEGRSGHVVAG